MFIEVVLNCKYWNWYSFDSQSLISWSWSYWIMTRRIKMIMFGVWQNQNKNHCKRWNVFTSIMILIITRGSSAVFNNQQNSILKRYFHFQCKPNLSFECSKIWHFPFLVIWTNALFTHQEIFIKTITFNFWNDCRWHIRLPFLQRKYIIHHKLNQQSTRHSQCKVWPTK